MNAFESFVEHGRRIAATKGINWEIRLDRVGLALPNEGWNLTRMSGASPPPTTWLRYFGTDRPTLNVFNADRAQRGEPAVFRHPLSQAWQDLIKAAVVDQLLVRRNTPRSAKDNVVRALRVLATCSGPVEPWQLSMEDAALAFRIAGLVQPAGKLSDLVFGVVKVIFDGNHLSTRGPLSPALTRNKRCSRTRAKFVGAHEKWARSVGLK